MTAFIQATFNGLLQGIVYAAIGAGLSLTLGVLGIINVAHSALALVAAYLGWTGINQLGLDPVSAFIIIGALFFFVGVLIERGLLKRLYAEEAWASLLVLFGLMIALETIANLVWTTTERAIRLPFSAAVEIAGYRLSSSRLLGGAIMLVAIIAVHAFLTYGRLGRGIRAMAANRDAAEILGINTERLSMILFGLGTALAAGGGIALGMIYPLTPQLHTQWLVLAILIVVIGGLGGLPQTMLAALAVALIETWTGLYISFRYVDVVLYLILIVLLWIRREGLAGVRERTL
jgi:branched-chain amino acid transport system permease protein